VSASDCLENDDNLGIFNSLMKKESRDGSKSGSNQKDDRSSSNLPNFGPAKDKSLERELRVTTKENYQTGMVNIS
jgi:hypothetical protein